MAGYNQKRVYPKEDFSMDKLKMQTANLAQENFKKLAEMFPSAVTESFDEYGDIVRSIDAEALRREIMDIAQVADIGDERYQFTWPGKSHTIVTSNHPIAKTLRLSHERSVGYNGEQGSIDSGNVYIEGDNLDALKLLQESYAGRIKMIYIDPPYNTGADFIYKDDFSKSARKYMPESGQFDDDGNRLVQNLESNGRFHTDWLNMIYPRLKFAKPLLSEDGVIFISIDDNEVENLKKVCNEIFGAQNFIDCLHWKKKKQPSFLAKHTAKLMEYVLVYAKNENKLEKLSIETLSDATKKVINVSNQETIRHFCPGVRVKIGDTGVIKAGRYKIKTMDVEYLQDITYEHGRTTNAVDVVSKFSVSQEKIDDFIKNDLLFITENKGLRRDVSYEETMQRKSITDLLLSEYGDNQDSDNEQRAIFNARYFDYSKPVKLIYNLIKSIICDQDSIILDFFSGSATTAHAVMQLNAEDGGSRKFILVQLPEACKKGSEAQKAGFKTICDIGEERIRRAGKKIWDSLNTPHPDPLPQGAGEHRNVDRILDIGFRTFYVDSTNMADVYYMPSEISQNTLTPLIDTVKPDRSDEDLLIQIMLENGMPLSSKIDSIELSDTHKAYIVQGDNDKTLIACFGSAISNDTVVEIAKMKPNYAIFRENGFKDDSTLANLDNIFTMHSPNTKWSIL